jgi:hypothetical protein
VYAVSTAFDGLWIVKNYDVKLEEIASLSAQYNKYWQQAENVSNISKTTIYFLAFDSLNILI